MHGITRRDGDVPALLHVRECQRLLGRKRQHVPRMPGLAPP
jgi:hypothetical protein